MTVSSSQSFVTWACVPLGLILIFICQSCSAAHVLVGLTVREFLPSFCLTEVELDLIWPNAEKYGVQQRLYSPGTVIDGITSSSRRFSIPPVWPEIDGGFPLKWVCPYFDWMRNDSISGHPDFFPVGSQVAYGASLCAEVQTDVCLDTQPIVKTKSTRSRGGVEKPEYCGSEAGPSRCGVGVRDNQTYSTSSTARFSSWFADDKKYNKRHSATIQLDQVKPSGPWVFNSSWQGTHFDPLAQDEIITEERFPDFRTAPYWPNPIKALVGPGHPLSSRLWFTMEMHEFFTFRGQNNDWFQVASTGDFWVFINGQLVADGGGIHASVMRSINLGGEISERVGLEAGDRFEFSLFFANRRPMGSDLLVSLNLEPSCDVTHTEQSRVPLSLFRSRSQASSMEEDGDHIFELSSSAYLSDGFWISGGCHLSFDFRISDEGQAFPIQLFAAHESPHKNVFLAEIAPCLNAHEECEMQKLQVTVSHQSGEVHTSEERVIAPLRGTWESSEENWHNVKVSVVTASTRSRGPNLLLMYLDGSLYLQVELPTLLNRPVFFRLESHPGSATTQVRDVTLETSKPYFPASRVVQGSGSSARHVILGGKEVRTAFAVELVDVCGNHVVNHPFKDEVLAVLVPRLPPNQREARYKHFKTIKGLISLKRELSFEFLVDEVGVYDLFVCIGPGCSNSINLTDGVVSSVDGLFEFNVSFLNVDKHQVFTTEKRRALVASQGDEGRGEDGSGSPSDDQSLVNGKNFLLVLSTSVGSFAALLCTAMVIYWRRSRQEGGFRNDTSADDTKDGPFTCTRTGSLKDPETQLEVSKEQGSRGKPRLANPMSFFGSRRTRHAESSNSASFGFIMSSRSRDDTFTTSFEEEEYDYDSEEDLEDNSI